ncbi:MAG: DUF3857 domain-containing protein [Bacteroidetes bacterium]|nr:MAG: DUF3857 domain-containing protein [Bacteroidota bacterium]
MKKTILFCACHLFALILLAQKSKGDPDLPGFGKVDKADLEMKQCDFDNKAEAMVMVDDGSLEYVYGSGTELKKRVRIKILNSKGLEWANVHLRYHSERNDEDITSLEAQTYNLDDAGNVVITKVEKKLIYEKKINKKFSEKVFTFPEVRVGSIIEFKYKHSNIGLIEWQFQRPIPVKYSHFVIDFPEEIEISTIPSCSHQYDHKKEEKSTRVIHTFSMSKIPAFRDEPYIINEDFYRDHLDIKITALNFAGRREGRTVNWLQVIRFLMEDEDFGIQLKKNIPRTADLDAKLKSVKEPYQRMKTIYKYVQDNMQWNEYGGIWAFDGVKSAWKDKKGTVGEINLILVNLLKDADLDAHAVLVSTHENGIVNTTDPGTYDYPGFNQFDKVMAFVEIDKKFYVLDATEKETTVHLIPPDVILSEGLVIEKIETFDWGWRTLWNKDLSSKNVVLITGEIDDKGKLSGEVTITSYDYARITRLQAAKKGKDKYTEKYITASNSGMTVDGVEFENLDSDSLPFVQKIKFSQALNSSGDYTYFSSNILSGLEKNPFIADSRFSDVFFGTNQSYMVYGNFVIPDDYTFEELPKSIKMIMPDTSISVVRGANVSGNRLMTKIQLDFNRPVYPASQYADFQEFYKQLFDLINEQYVIRKKK